MQHLAKEFDPQAHGLTPYRVAFRRAESRPYAARWAGQVIMCAANTSLLDF
jgi:hypothetical protein